MKYRLFCLATVLVVRSLCAAEPATPPQAAATDTASHVVLPAGQKLGEKSTLHRFEKLRAGADPNRTGMERSGFRLELLQSDR